MKRSFVQRKSYGSVTVFWLDREELRSRLASAATTLRSRRPEVREVRLFGSLHSDRATATSDADILVVVEQAGLPALGRHEPYVEFFRDIGFPVEIFVHSVGEQPAPIARTALAAGTRLA